MSGTKIIEKTLALVFFSSLFFTLTMPISDPDFWWHLATGRWMWEHASLMHEDPFNFVFFDTDSPMRRDFILKQYWLSQLLFYGIHRLTGFQGLVALRATVLTLMFYTVYRLMRREGAGPMLSLSLVYLSSLVVVTEFIYVGVKPQIFSSLFFVVLVYLLEVMRTGKRWAYLALPLLMLFWGNMHAGFVLGDVIIVIYLCCALIFHKKTRLFYISTVSALLLSGLNPNGFVAFMSVASTFFDIEALRYWKSIVESQSLFEHASIGGIVTTLPFLSALAIISLASFVLNVRQAKTMRIEFVLLYALVLFMGVNAIRYIIFFAMAASFIAAINLRGFIGQFPFTEQASIAARKVLVVLTIPLVLFFSYTMARKAYAYSSFRSEKGYISDYNGAADFISQNRLSGNIMNDYSPGGYLIWRLYPDIKVFSDGRALSYQGFNLYSQVVDWPLLPTYPPYDLTPRHESVLEKYDIELVVLSGCDRASGVSIPLTRTLIEDDRWAIVYGDATALVFMRDIPENRAFIEKYGLPKAVGYDNILAMASSAMKRSHAHIVPGVKFSLAFAFNGKGERQSALYWVNEYLKVKPDDPTALEFRNRILDVAR